MDEARRAKFENLLNDTREDIKSVDILVERELEEVKTRLASLQAEKELQLNIYDNYCRLLGVPNDLAEDDDDDLDEELDG